MTRAIVATGATIGLTTWAAIHVGGDGTSRLLVLGAVSTALVMVGLIVSSPEILAGGITGVVGVCAIAVAVEPGPEVLPIGLGAFVLAEAAFGAVALGPSGATSAAAELQRLRFVAAVMVLSGLASSLALIVAGDLSTPQSLAVEALGAVAIAAIAVLVATFSRRAQPPNHKLNRR